ncbi:MAG: acyl-CoA dehydrogenase [Rhodospirillaceae bacterium]|nr:acyl-CoA dehydrogenase [Rhodospirillaceae bacterium]|tara:strand:+ start:2945 stop:4117 length:1173 start_codon:yes stop_codon:yes gene_type:complete
MEMTFEDDYTEFRDAVAAICKDFPGKYWRDLEDQPSDGSYPTDFVDALTQSGFLAALIPESYGGSGLPIRAGAVILEAIHESGCSAAACHAQMYTMGTILRHGSEEQKQKYLPQIAKGSLRLQAFGVTEPNTGSDTTQLKTKAERDGNGYVINGQKVWTSRAAHSDLMLLLARTTPPEECEKRTDGLSCFLIDLREVTDNGCQIKPLDAMINHNTTEVFFDNMHIPGDALIGQEGKGFRYILDGMNAERVLIAGESLGDGKFFIDKGVSYANERVVFDRPIGQNQGIQFPLAKSWAELQGADIMARKAAALFDSGRPCGAEANMAKYQAAKAAWEAAEACLMTHGGFGFAREYDVERKWREARLYRTAPVSENMILAYIGQNILGMPRSY